MYNSARLLVYSSNAAVTFVISSTPSCCLPPLTSFNLLWSRAGKGLQPVLHAGRAPTLHQVAFFPDHPPVPLVGLFPGPRREVGRRRRAGEIDAGLARRRRRQQCLDPATRKPRQTVCMVHQQGCTLDHDLEGVSFVAILRNRVLLAVRVDQTLPVDSLYPSRLCRSRRALS